MHSVCLLRPYLKGKFIPLIYYRGAGRKSWVQGKSMYRSPLLGQYGPQNTGAVTKPTNCRRLPYSPFFAYSPSLSIRKMKVVAAYLLAVLGGNNNPSADDVKKILGSVGAEADDDRIKLFLSEVKGKDIVEVIAAGREKLASVPSGGGGAVAVAAAPGGGAAAAPAAEAKKEEKVEEKEESDDDMGFSLFD
ncbi:hypothetical protein VNO78_21022 [Psophocarpus tetragonolobus]|uniref:60S acidic ribosomal protein P2 n=1 Tax=Psophocarpus tetragonolobus TaxID=3891 RepID=A0AAN9SC01_PSOTE